MFPDMYLQYNHPTNKSQQKPFDKKHQYHIPLHPPQRRFHTPPHNASTTASIPHLSPQRIHHSIDSTPFPTAPIPHSPHNASSAAPMPHHLPGNSAPAAIQRSADGPPPSVRPPLPHTPKNQNGQTASGAAAWSGPGASE